MCVCVCKVMHERQGMPSALWDGDLLSASWTEITDDFLKLLSAIEPPVICRCCEVEGIRWGHHMRKEGGL